MYTHLQTVPRLLLEADLRPVQGTRFQPTGFPDLGAAEFTAKGNKSCLLVESAQSMANRLEETIWDEADDDLVAPLRGMPFVKANAGELGMTNSILEAHRLNSPYIIGALKEEIMADMGWNGKSDPSLSRLARYLLKQDPNSLLHGVFLEKVGGKLRLARLLSSFIEAEDVTQVTSGGVKFDRLDAQGAAKEGKGHVPFHRVEYTSEKIVAYFNLDLHRLRGYGLGEEAENFITTLALYKIRRFLDYDLRLRTACDLEVKELRAVRPPNFELESQEVLAKRLSEQVAQLSRAGQFAQPPVREVSLK
jgi:CRISPR-associated protein Csb1